MRKPSIFYHVHEGYTRGWKLEVKVVGETLPSWTVFVISIQNTSTYLQSVPDSQHQS